MRKLFLILFAIPALFFVGCSSDDDPKPVEENLTANLTKLDFNSEAGSSTFTITSNASWTVSSDAAWCTVSPASGSNNATITVAVANYDGFAAPRVAKVTAKLVSGAIEQIVTVTQMSETPTISLEYASLNIEEIESVFTVEVTANVGYDITIDADWLEEHTTPAVMSSMVTKAVSFKALANTSSALREAKVTFKQVGGTITQTLTVTQAIELSNSPFAALLGDIIMKVGEINPETGMSKNESFNAQITMAEGKEDELLIYMTIFQDPNGTAKPLVATVKEEGDEFVLTFKFHQDGGAILAAGLPTIYGLSFFEDQNTVGAELNFDPLIEVLARTKKNNISITFDSHAELGVIGLWVAAFQDATWKTGLLSAPGSWKFVKE